MSILQELEDTNVVNKTQSQPLVTVDQIWRKYSTSKSKFIVGNSNIVMDDCNSSRAHHQVNASPPTSYVRSN